MSGLPIVNIPQEIALPRPGVARVAGVNRMDTDIALVEFFDFMV